MAACAAAADAVVVVALFRPLLAPLWPTQYAPLPCPLPPSACSKPSVSVLKTSNTTFDVTVAPVVVTPGVSFPSPTVWTYYRLNMTIGGVSTLINCT